MYNPGAKNHADALTRREQDIDNQIAAKIALRTQTLLGPERLDPRIITECIGNLVPGTEIFLIDNGLDFIDELLQANRTASSLQEYREAAKDKDNWTIDNGLLKYQERLVVLEDNNLRTRLIKEAHAQVSTAHPGKIKTCKIIGDRYYWPGMTVDIDQYIRNCNDCRRSTILRDKTPGLLKPLPIPERLWQHVSVDFHEVPKDCNSYNIVIVCINRFRKRPISLLCKKTINAKGAARLYINYLFWIYRLLDTIISN